ncbi:DUF5787 family protein [Natronococcus jeotgali]|uniref:Uncharacterized protein n=1 Tax=Natronococcus jeotgali DSM 18795 TaxID=1227498 RepID=L9WTA9_9EURY|nr:DUF5787 family protein [Natronococcus jeotgali]ELY51543.1 hypothetical protein C492_20720 [Natronococcus jeotgali DSM 18795]
MTRATDSEFAFELRTCRWAERAWPPAEDVGDDRAVLVARQLGTKRRRWDTIVFECDREALERRANFGPKRLDSDLLHVVRNAPADWRYYRDALPDPGYPWRYVREAIHEADDRGVLETRKSGNRIEIRRKWEYPEWVDRIVAIENKPDLDASAARNLAAQLEYDVALGLADEVWVATRATGERVEPVLFEDLPVEAGVLALEPESPSADVAWYPRSLSVGEPGTRVLERPEGGRRDGSAARFEYVPPKTKAEKRLAIAERAYERGWRSFADTMRPDCRHFALRGTDGTQLRPYCGAKGRCQTAAECSGACSEFEPEPPRWRTKGWPIEGGPGTRCRRLLEERRRRRRPGL